MSLDLTQRTPLIGGIAVGARRFGDWNGTISVIVRYANKRMILSCYHVLVGDNNPPSKDPICQPSTSQNVVAKLWSEFAVGINRDAALAEIEDQNLANNASNQIFDFPIAITGFATDLSSITTGMAVMKRGIATRRSNGVITGFGWTTAVGYPKLPNRSLKLRDQIQLKFNPPTLSGDSGSAIVLPDGRIIGILVGGDQNGFSYATPIQFILQKYPGLSL
jgi:hypothetical protein